jgi:hypothetical protein
MWHTWEKSACKVFVAKPEEKNLGRPSHRWEGNSLTDLKEIILEQVEWIYLAQDRDSGLLYKQ